jgi:hypothetical protein
MFYSDFIKSLKVMIKEREDEIAKNNSLNAELIDLRSGLKYFEKKEKDVLKMETKKDWAIFIKKYELFGFKEVEEKYYIIAFVTIDGKEGLIKSNVKRKIPCIPYSICRAMEEMFEKGKWKKKDSYGYMMINCIYLLKS